MGMLEAVYMIYLAIKIMKSNIAFKSKNTDSSVNKKDGNIFNKLQKQLISVKIELKQM